MRRVPLNVALALLTVLAVGACSSTAGTAAGGSKATDLGASASTAAGSSTNSVSGGQSSGTVDVCKLVTAADVEQLFPGTVTAATEPTNASGCSYVFQPEDQGLSIEVVKGDMAASFWTGSIAPQGAGSIPLHGIGDQAMRAAGSPDLVAIKGTTFCEIETNGAAELYQGLATPDAHDQVSDATANAIAQKLGTLCARIFAAG